MQRAQWWDRPWGKGATAGVDGLNGPLAGHPVPVVCAGNVVLQDEFEEQGCPGLGISWGRDLGPEQKKNPLIQAAKNRCRSPNTQRTAEWFPARNDK